MNQVTGGSEPPAGAKRRQAVVAAVVVVALVAGVAIVRCSSGSGPDEPDADSASRASAATAASTVTTGSPATQVRGVDRGGGRFVDEVTGIEVVVPEGSVSGPTTVVVEPTALPAPIGEAFTLAAPVVDVSLSGAELLGAVRVTFPVTDDSAFDPVEDMSAETIPDTAAFSVIHFTGSEWEPLPTEIDPVGRTATATATSLSPLALVHIAADFVKSLAIDLTEALTKGIFQDVPEPACEGTPTPQLWEADPADNPVSWCAAERDDGSRFLQVANRRRYAVAVSADGGTVTGRSGDLAAQLSQLASRPGTVVLAPGETADVVFPAAITAARVVVEYDGLAQALTSLLVAADILAAIATRIPFAKTRTAKEFLELLDLSGCVTALGTDVVQVVTSPASTIAKLITSCFTTVLKKLKLVGVLLFGPLATIAGVLSYFISAGAALFDLIVGGANGTLTLDTTATASTTTTTISDGTASSVWPVGDDEGPPALWALMGAGLFIADWVSCSPNFCIAGQEDEVHLYRLDGLEDLGFLPIDTPNPTQEFIDAGVPAEDVTAFMTPGEP